MRFELAGLPMQRGNFESLAAVNVQEVHEVEQLDQVKKVMLNICARDRMPNLKGTHSVAMKLCCSLELLGRWWG